MSFALLPAALAIAGGVVGAAGSIYSGGASANAAIMQSENQARTLEAQADTDRFNAKVYQQMARGEKEKAAIEAGDFKRLQSAKHTTSVARQSTSGFALEGSPLLVDESIWTEIDFGASRIGYGGDIASHRMREQASLLKYSAKVNDTNASFARTAGNATAGAMRTASYINAAGSLLKGFSMAAGGASSNPLPGSAPMGQGGIGSA